MADNLLESYNPLYDPYLRQYFALPHMQKHLRNLGLLDGTADKEQLHAGHLQMMDLMLRNRERVLQQLMDLQRKLDAAEKVELYRRIRSGITNADELNRSHMSRSLSRPARSAVRSGRAADMLGGGGEGHIRRQSLSPEAGELIKRVETDYRSDSAPFKNPKSIYNRLAANVYKYQYLHKLDDRTLRKYMNSLRKQLAKLERFREVSFGKETMAKHPPSQLQQSWFFRRRSLPSLDTTTGANHHHPPQPHSSQPSHHHQLPPPPTHANAGPPRSLKSGRKSRSGKSQSPLRVSALEEPPNKVQRTSVSRTRGPQRLPPLQPNNMAASASANKKRSLGVRTMPPKSGSTEQKLPPTAVIKPTRKMPPPPEQAVRRPPPVSAGAKAPAGKKTPPAVPSRPLSQKGSITPVAVQKPAAAAGGGILPAIGGALVGAAIGAGIAGAVAATVTGTGEEENRESGAPSPSISLAASQTTTTDGGQPGVDSEWEGEQQPPAAPESVGAEAEAEYEEVVNGGTETRPTPEPFLEQPIETKLVVGDLGMVEGPEEVPMGEEEEGEEQLTARASIHSAPKEEEEEHPMAKESEKEQQQVQEPQIDEAFQQREEDQSLHGHEQVEEEDAAEHANNVVHEPEPRNVFATEEEEKAHYRVPKYENEKEEMPPEFVGREEEEEQPKQMEEEEFRQINYEHPEMVVPAGVAQSPPPEEPHHPFEEEESADGMGNAEQEQEAAAQQSFLIKREAEEIPEFEEQQRFVEQKNVSAEHEEAERFKREIPDEFEALQKEEEGEFGGEHEKLIKQETTEWTQRDEMESGGISDNGVPGGMEGVQLKEPFEEEGEEGGGTPAAMMMVGGMMDANESEQIRRFSHLNIELETGPDESVRSLDGSVDAFEQSKAEEVAGEPEQQELVKEEVVVVGSDQHKREQEGEEKEEVRRQTLLEEKQHQQQTPEMEERHEQLLTTVEEPEQHSEEMAKSPVQIEITPSPENRNWDEEEEEKQQQEEEQEQIEKEWSQQQPPIAFEEEQAEHVVDAHAQMPLTEEEEVPETKEAIKEWEKEEHHEKQEEEKEEEEEKDINGNFGGGKKFDYEEEEHLLSRSPEHGSIVDASAFVPQQDVYREKEAKLYNAAAAAASDVREQGDKNNEEEEKENQAHEHETSLAHFGHPDEFVREEQQPLKTVETTDENHWPQGETDDTSAQTQFVHSEPVYGHQQGDEGMPDFGGTEVPATHEYAEHEQEEWQRTQSDGEHPYQEGEGGEEEEEHFERIKREATEFEGAEVGGDKHQQQHQQASPGVVDNGEFVESESVQAEGDEVGRKLSGADAQLGLAMDERQMELEKEQHSPEGELPGDVAHRWPSEPGMSPEEDEQQQKQHQDEFVGVPKQEEDNDTLIVQSNPFVVQQQKQHEVGEKRLMMGGEVAATDSTAIKQQQQQQLEKDHEVESPAVEEHPFEKGSKSQDEEKQEVEQQIVESEPIMHDEMDDRLLNYYGKPHWTNEEEAAPGEGTNDAALDDENLERQQQPIVVVEPSIVAPEEEERPIGEEAAAITTMFQSEEQQHQQSPPSSLHIGSRPATADGSATNGGGNTTTNNALLSQPSIEITPASEYGGFIEDNRDIPLTPSSQQAHPPSTVEEEEEQQPITNAGAEKDVEGEHANREEQHHQHHDEQQQADWYHRPSEQANSLSVEEEKMASELDDAKEEEFPTTTGGDVVVEPEMGEFYCHNGNESNMFEYEQQHQQFPSQHHNGYVAGNETPNENGEQGHNVVDSAKNVEHHQHISPTPLQDEYDDGGHQGGGGNGHLSPTNQNEGGTSSPETEGADEESSDAEGSVVIHQEGMHTDLLVGDQQHPQFQTAKFEKDEDARVDAFAREQPQQM